MNKKALTLVSALMLVAAITQAQYKVVKTFHINSAGGWDYISTNGNYVYVSHGNQVNVLDKNTGDSVGIIENTAGVHGIAFADNLNKGFTSNGRSNNITVFDLKTLKPITQIATGQNPDAIMYDNFSKMVITCNGRSNDLSIIDPVAGKLVATVDVGGKPETAVSDDAGKLFVNNEDKSEIVEINTKTWKVENHWPLAPAEGPTGLAYDKATKRLFAGCNKMLAVMDATSGKIIATPAIGNGCDGVAFDAASKNVFTSNGEGTMTVIHENSANDFKVVATVPTKARARTIGIDSQNHKLYLPTAEFEAAPAGGNGRGGRMVPGTFQILVVDKG